MRIKPVHVLDDMTDVWFLVGKMSGEDKEWMSWAGWGGIDIYRSPTLILKPRADQTDAVISHFNCPHIDLQEKGIDVDHTVVSLVMAVRGASFEEILGEYDFTNVGGDSARKG